MVAAPPPGAGITAGLEPSAPVTDVTRIAGGLVCTMTGRIVPVDGSEMITDRS